MLFNPIELSQKIPIQGLRKPVLDVLLNVGIPFNRWLGLKITELSPQSVVITSPARKLRENHVGGAHACAIALMGEYPAGLLIAQSFPINEYRFVISELQVSYAKQGFGVLTARAEAPSEWPSLAPREKDGRLEGWVNLVTEIKNSKQEVVATAKTRWQILK